MHRANRISVAQNAQFGTARGEISQVLGKQSGAETGHDLLIREDWHKKVWFFNAILTLPSVFSITSAYMTGICIAKLRMSPTGLANQGKFDMRIASAASNIIMRQCVSAALLTALACTTAVADDTDNKDVVVGFSVNSTQRDSDFAVTTRAQSIWQANSDVALGAHFVRERSEICADGRPCESPLVARWREDDRYAIGASLALPGLSFSFDYFNQSTNSAYDGDGLDFIALDTLSAAEMWAWSSPSLGQAFSRSQGFDLGLVCEIDAGAVGNLALDFQISRVTDQGVLIDDQLYNSDPYTKAAMGVGWQRGDFSGNLTSRFSQAANGLSDGEDSYSALDIDFAWQTPWRGSLQVGARNVLSTAPSENGSSDSNIDRFIGRVPYVRYYQDF